MNDTDWKRKHLDSLREMEIEERRWRAAEQTLRRLIARLCAVAHGAAPELDARLAALADATRRDAEPDDMWELSERLTDTARMIPDTPPAPAPEGVAELDAHRFGELVLRLAERLSAALPGAETAALEPLRAALDGGAPATDLLVLLEAAVDGIAAHAAALNRERDVAAAILHQVEARLAEMTAYLAGAGTARREDHEATESFNVDVLTQVSRLSDEVRAGNDLDALRALVSGRLEAVGASLEAFRAREERRFHEQDGRDRQMRERIGELELQMHDLGRQLDAEKRRARIDPLTRVANRASFDERLAQELARVRRTGGPTVLLVWDVDRFKAVNDAHGHRAGDALLRTVAECLGRNRREVDFLGRYGGEEFVMLLTGSGLAEAHGVAESARGAVAALKMHFRGTPVAITISCGLTQLRPDDTAATAFERADAALYRAKQEGRDRCVAD